MYIHIEVAGLPPKKDGANSMWRKSTEVPRLQALRLAVVTALENFPKRSKGGEIELSLRLYAPPQAGDLDNFITGICDGLMAASPQTSIDNKFWQDLPEEIHPHKAIAWYDDKQVCHIEAERQPQGQRPIRYELTIIYK